MERENIQGGNKGKDTSKERLEVGEDSVERTVEAREEAANDAVRRCATKEGSGRCDLRNDAGGEVGNVRVRLALAALGRLDGVDLARGGGELDDDFANERRGRGKGRVRRVRHFLCCRSSTQSKTHAEKGEYVLIDAIGD
jgi:hypothetical protein